MIEKFMKEADAIFMRFAPKMRVILEDNPDNPIPAPQRILCTLYGFTVPAVGSIINIPSFTKVRVTSVVYADVTGSRVKTIYIMVVKAETTEEDK